MKKLFLLLIISASVQFGFAQKFELKINPVIMPFNVWQINGEFLVNEDIGIEPGVIFIPEEDISLFSVLGKYYFSPKKGNDGFHIGMFGQFIVPDAYFGLGFYTGYKWLSRRGVTFELGAGIGRILNPERSYGYYSETNITGTGQATVGYRFGYGKTQVEKNM